jgi:hypothetical protein
MVVSSERHITTEGFTMYGISADRSEDLAVAEYTAYLQGHRYASRTVDLFAQCHEDFFGWRSRTRRRGRGPDEALISAASSREDSMDLNTATFAMTATARKALISQSILIFARSSSRSHGSPTTIACSCSCESGMPRSCLTPARIKLPS